MKKKLLTILLSVFMIFGCFVNVVNADDIKVSDVLAKSANTFPTNANDAWIQTGGSGKVYINGSNLCFTGGTEDFNLSLDITVTADTRGSFSIYPNDSQTYLCTFNTYEVEDTLTAITLNYPEGSPGCSYNGDYGPAVPSHTHDFKYSANGATITIKCNITDCPDEFYRIPGKLTLVENNGVISTNKKDGNYHLIDVFPSEQLNNIEYYQGEAKLENAPTESGNYTAKITMGSGDNTATASLDYTYTAPIKTVSNVLPSGFPTSKETGWTYNNINNPKLYLKGTDLYIGDNLLIPGNIEVTSQTGYYEVTYNGTNIKIHPSTESSPNLIDVIVGSTFKTYQKTIISHVFAASNDVPVSGSKWNNNSGKKLYRDFKQMVLATLFIASEEIDFMETVDYDNGNYIYNNEYTLTFNIYNNVLESITVSDYVVSNYNGCYTKQKFISSNNQEFDINSNDDLEFIVTATYENPGQVTVTIDGTEIFVDSDYTLSTGSTHVKLNNSYLKTLTEGEHTIGISIYGHDNVTQKFKVIDPTVTPTPNPNSGISSGYKIPKTGVDGTPTNNHSLLKLSSLSLLAIGTYIVIKKKKDDK